MYQAISAKLSEAHKPVEFQWAILLVTEIHNVIKFYACYFLKKSVHKLSVDLLHDTIHISEDDRRIKTQFEFQ